MGSTVQNRNAKLQDFVRGIRESRCAKVDFKLLLLTRAVKLPALVSVNLLWVASGTRHKDAVRQFRLIYELKLGAV